jgi:hypothetical protein
MQQRGTFPFGKSDLNDWYKAPDPLPWMKGSTRSYTWGDASDLHAFLTDNGSQAVQYAQAQPGDVLFYRNDSQGIYHAAVITAVVNGQVFYTQHTPGELNADWGSRQFMPQTSNPANPTNLIVVRPGADTGPAPTPAPDAAVPAPATAPAAATVPAPAVPAQPTVPAQPGSPSRLPVADPQPGTAPVP